MPIAAFVFVLISSTLAGMSGFGFGLITVPLLAMVIAPQVVVPTVRVLSIWISVLVLLDAWRSLSLRSSWLLITGSLAGVPFGTYLLSVWDASTLKVFIGSLTVLFALALMSGVRMQVREGSPVTALVGFMSGILGSSAGMGGPPAVIFYTGQGVEKQAFRANLAAFFIIQALFSIPTYIAGHLFTGTVVTYILLLLPALVIGGALGIKLAQRFDEGVFRRVTLWMVLATGLLSIASGLHII
jgi:uncharacterized membrane protein YfcA